MREQSYILHLLLFVFITVWFVTPPHKPGKKNKGVLFFFYIGKGIFIASKFLTLLQFPIALKDCNSYFQGCLLSGWYHRLPLSFLFLLFYTVFVNWHEEPEVAYKFKSDFFFLIPKQLRVSSGWNKNKHIWNSLKQLMGVKMLVIKINATFLGKQKCSL